MAQPIVKVQPAPKSVYFPQHESKPAPVKVNVLVEQSQEQKRV